jgi:hypothetical protein
MKGRYTRYMTPDVELILIPFGLRFMFAVARLESVFVLGVTTGINGTGRP